MKIHYYKHIFSIDRNINCSIYEKEKDFVWIIKHRRLVKPCPHEVICDVWHVSLLAEEDVLCEHTNTCCIKV